MAIECEAKLKVDDLRLIRERLRELGGVDEGTVMERNWVLDRPDESLYRRDILLRVRNNGEVGGILTVKGKVESGAFKSREEVESMVDSTEDLLRQLKMVGFEVKWIYEKRRNTWLWRDCVLALDLCPEIGSFMEIEGEEKQIRAVAQALGLNPDNHIQENYLALWKAHLKQRGEGHRDMVFSE